MALTGVMGADFSKFTDAVDGAEIKLRNFESGAAKVATSLSKMGNAFSGQKVVQDATLMAKVFEEMGGAASFTEKELVRMNATATEAIAKLTALGKDVPPGIQRIADETKGAATASESWSASLAKVVAGYLSFQAAQAAARAAVEFIKDIAAQAGALADLSAQTRIGVEDLQILGNAMRDFGVDQDQLGKALFKLNKQIAGGDDSIAAALKTMGLTLEQVRGMKGTQLFETLQDGLSKLNGGLRDTTAVTLYGDKLGMVMSGAAEGSQEAIDKARELNEVMSEDAVQALDRASEAWDRWTNKAKAWVATNILGPTIKGIEDYIAVAEKAGNTDTALASYKDMLMTALGKEKHYLDDLALSVGVDTNATEDNTRATRDAADAKNNFGVQVGTLTDLLKKQREEWAKHVADVKERNENNAKGIALMERDFQLAQARAAFDKEQLEIDKKKHETGKAYVDQMTEIAKVNKAAADFQKNIPIEQAKIDEENKKLIASWGAAGAASTEAGSKAVDGATEAAMAQAQLNTQINLTIGNVKEWIELQQYSAAANAILSQNGLYTSGSQYENIARMGSAFTGILPGRAAGGPVNAGQAYVVGEQGPELFIPNVGGAIAAGGGSSITNIFHLVDTESNLARRVSEQIMRQVRAGTQLATT
jgi:hypothetical protein